MPPPLVIVIIWNMSYEIYMYFCGETDSDSDGGHRLTPLPPHPPRHSTLAVKILSKINERFFSLVFAKYYIKQDILYHHFGLLSLYGFSDESLY